MSQPLIDLQRLITGRRAVTGRVVAVTGGMVRVAMAQGVVEVAGDANLQPGDRVTVRDGRAVKTHGNGDAPVFFV